MAQEYITITGRAMPYGTAYQYDAADRLTRLTYPNGEWVTTTYDAGGQPYSLLGWSAYVVSATYNALGQPARTRFGNGLEARYTYFTPQELPWAGLANYGRLRRICVLPQGSGVSLNCESDAMPPVEALLNIALNYDAAGNVTVWRDAGQQERQRFEYDSLNRLIASRPDPVTNCQPALAAYTETYAYDAIGNFVSKGGVMQWYSDTAHAHAVTHLKGDRRAWYDANGNMTQRVEVAVVDRSGSQRITYTQEWDIENKLVAITSTLGQVTRFYADCIRRDADAALVKKSDGAGTVMIVGTHFEHITTTNQSTSYYLFGGQRVAMRVAGAVYWLHGDHLGSASLTTNVSGQRVAELRYLPFGETRWMSRTTPTARRYAGQHELAAIGLYYLPLSAGTAEGSAVACNAGLSWAGSRLTGGSTQNSAPPTKRIAPHASSTADTPTAAESGVEMSGAIIAPMFISTVCPAMYEDRLAGGMMSRKTAGWAMPMPVSFSVLRKPITRIGAENGKSTIRQGYRPVSRTVRITTHRLPLR